MEAGGHRIQRVPPSEKRGRVHTSTVTVAVFSGADDARGHEAGRPDEDYRVEWYSGSGAGGQHRNKHQNSCRLTHIPTGIVRTAQTRKRESSLREARLSLDRALDELMRETGHVAMNSTRRGQVGSGMRGDKKRTYRFQDDRVQDHDTGRTISARKAMSGHIDTLWV